MSRPDPAIYPNGIQLACIGAGTWGKNLVRNFHALGAPPLKGSPLSWICEVSPERQADLSAQYPGVRLIDSLEPILSDPQVAGVAIATPAETHGKLVRQALLTGKDVFVEKLLCLSIAEGQELVSLASQLGRVLMVGHLLWYHPAVLKLQELVEAGKLGRIQYIYSNRLNLGKIRREENILWSFAPHDISVILALVGEMPEAIDAQGGNYLHNQIADVTMSLLSFPSGVKAHIFVSWLYPFKEQKLIVVGDRKMAVFDDVEEKEKLLLYPHVIGWKNHLPVANRAQARPVAFDWEEPPRAECRHFLDYIRNRSLPRTDGKEALRVLTILQSCQQRLERGSNGVPPQPTPPARPYFAHESAFIDEGVEIGEGTTLCHVSHVLK